MALLMMTAGCSFLGGGGTPTPGADDRPDVVTVTYDETDSTGTPSGDGGAVTEAPENGETPTPTSEPDASQTPQGTPTPFPDGETITASEYEFPSGTSSDGAELNRLVSLAQIQIQQTNGLVASANQNVAVEEGNYRTLDESWRTRVNVTDKAFITTHDLTVEFFENRGGTPTRQVAFSNQTVFVQPDRYTRDVVEGKEPQYENESSSFITTDALVIDDILTPDLNYELEEIRRTSENRSRVIYTADESSNEEVIAPSSSVELVSLDSRLVVSGEGRILAYTLNFVTEDADGQRVEYTTNYRVERMGSVSIELPAWVLQTTSE